MGTECAYKSSAPEVLAEWEDTQRRHREWNDRLRQFVDQFPDHNAMIFQGSACSLAGLSDVNFGDHKAPGPLWRFDQRRGFWVPKKTTKDGKALAAEVDSIKETHLGHMPGMPDTAMSGNTWHHPGIKEVDGVVYVSWGCGPERVEDGEWSKSPLDKTLWERCPLSEYYAAVESKTADA